MVRGARARIGTVAVLILVPLFVAIGPLAGGRSLSAPLSFARISDAPPVVARLTFHRPYISGDGRYVLYREQITDNFEVGILRDRSNPKPADQEVIAYPPLTAFASMQPILSRDGCHVAYWVRISGAAALPWTAWVWDRCVAGAAPVPTPLFTWTNPGQYRDVLSISADGRYLAAIVRSDPQSTDLVQRFDRAGAMPDALKTMPAISIDPCPTPFAYECDLSYASDLDIADDGSYVAVVMHTGPDPGDYIDAGQIVGWTPASDAQEYVTTAADGSVNFSTTGIDPSVSADGHYVAYIAGLQAFVRDRVAGRTRMLTETPGTEMPGAAYRIDITPDGSQVALEYTEDCDCSSQAVVAYPANGPDPVTHYETTSVGPNGNVSDGASEVVISATGRYVAFASFADVELGGPAPLATVPGSDLGSGPQPEGNREDVWLHDRVPSLAISPPVVDFGLVVAGQSSAVESTTVTNTSTVVVPITAVSALAPPFVTVSDGCSGVALQPGASCVIGVQYRPTAPQSSTATLTVTGDGDTVSNALQGTSRPQDTTTSSTVPPTTTSTTTTTTVRPLVRTTTTTVPGRAVLTAGPTTLDFGSTIVGTNVGPQTVTVTNTGTAPTNIARGTIGGSGGDQFSVLTDGCGARALAARASCTVSFQAGPTHAGASAATFTVTGSGGLSAVVRLEVAATFAPTLRVSPGVLRPGGVADVVGTGFPPNTPVQLALEGGGPVGTPTADAAGGFRFHLLVFQNDPRTGGKVMVAVDQPGLFAGVRTTFLIELATFTPAGSANPALTNGVRSLVSRSG